MNLLIYSHAFAPSVGGVETYTMLLAQGIARGRGDERDGPVTVTVATPTPREGFDDAALPFRVVRRPSPWTLWQLLGEVDVAHLAGPAFVPLVLGLLRRRPVVIEHHGYQAVCPNGLLFHEPTKTACPGYFMKRRYHRCLHCNAAIVGWRGSLRKLLMTFARRWLCGRAHANVPVSHHVLRRLQLPRSRVIYHGVDAAPPQPEPPQRQASTASNPICFAYVGRLVSEKGPALLIEAASRMKKQGHVFRLKVIGDGPERRRLEALTDDLDLRSEVSFTGALDGQALEAAFASVTALAMPSVMEETAGLAAMEQMMRGRLVIAADVGGLGEVVGDAALKFAPGDVVGLTERLTTAVEEPGRLAELAQRGRERAATLFGRQRMVDEHIATYRRLLELRVGP